MTAAERLAALRGTASPDVTEALRRAFAFRRCLRPNPRVREHRLYAVGNHARVMLIHGGEFGQEIPTARFRRDLRKHGRKHTVKRNHHGLAVRVARRLSRDRHYPIAGEVDSTPFEHGAVTEPQARIDSHGEE